MKGDDKYLAELLEGAKTRFIIPVYQRNYDWKLKNCERLFDDLIDLAGTNKESHFFGSIVSSALSEERVIIDGQQRITTTFLLLLALVHSLSDGTITSEDESLSEKITEMYLIDKWNKDEHKLKLKLVKNDHNSLARINAMKFDEMIMESNVTRNYLYFKKRIAEMKIDPVELFNAIEALQIIDIKLGRDDDAQLIFESLNSTGLALTEGDKIRNYILMDLKPDVQEHYYDEFWNKIEKNTSYKVSWFVRDYLTAKTRETPAINKTYQAFRDFSEKENVLIEDLLADLHRYSEYYATIISASTSSKSVNNRLRRIGLLEAGVTTPFLLSLLQHWDQEEIDEDTVCGVLEAIESYLFRRWVCGVPTNALNKIFQTLHSETMKFANDSVDYKDILVYNLLNRSGTSGRFPNDEEFVKAMEERDFYRIGNKKLYIYDCLENEHSRERVPVVKGLQDELYTIEHIMPQTLSKKWKDDLGDRWEDIHQKWINSLANLTITGYNSEYSNRSFAEKRDTKNGFENSGLRINKWIARQEKWTEEELLERNALLQKQFLILWSMPQSDYTPTEPIKEKHSLDEDFDFTGRWVAAYEFLGSRLVTKTWKDMLVEVLKMLTEYDATIMHQLAKEEAYPGSHFRSEEADCYNKVVDGVYVYTATGTITKLDLLKRVLDLYRIKHDELIFEIQPQEITEQ